VGPCYPSALWLEDDSGDGVFSPGETVWIYYEVVNDGPVPVEVQVEVDGPDLITREDAWFLLEPGERRMPARPLRAIIQPDVRPRTLSPVDLWAGGERRSAILFVQSALPRVAEPQQNSRANATQNPQADQLRPVDRAENRRIGGPQKLNAEALDGVQPEKGDVEESLEGP
jgi:hypothetical protein